MSLSPTLSGVNLCSLRPLSLLAAVRELGTLCRIHHQHTTLLLNPINNSPLVISNITYLTFLVLGLLGTQGVNIRVRLNILCCVYRKFMLEKMWCFTLHSMGCTNHIFPKAQHRMFEHSCTCIRPFRMWVVTPMQLHTLSLF